MKLPFWEILLGVWGFFVFASLINNEFLGAVYIIVSTVLWDVALVIFDAIAHSSNNGTR